MKTSNKLENLDLLTNKQNKIEYNLDKVFYKQISNKVFQNEEKFTHLFSNEDLKSFSI